MNTIKKNFNFKTNEKSNLIIKVTALSLKHPVKFSYVVIQSCHFEIKILNKKFERI